MDVLLPFALILVAFYFLILRPQRTRARQAAELQAQLAPGAEIMTTSGIFATVTEIRDESVVLEVSPGVTLRVAKAAVGRVVTPGESNNDGLDDEPVDPADAAPGQADTDAETRRRGSTAD